MTSDTAAPAVAASVLFLRMRGWGENLPSEQSRRRTQLAAALRAALAAWTEDRRVVLEAVDGLAVVGEADPAMALKAARLAAQATQDGSVGIGLHHGPVRATGESTAEVRVQGDGVETAAALAGFAGPHALVASQSFREALAVRSPHQAETLCSAGEVLD
jgi:class 3 adenylate cyclase